MTTAQAPSPPQGELHVTFSKGISKKWRFVTTLNQVASDRMYSEDLSNGYPIAIASESRRRRNEGGFLSVVNGLLGYSSVVQNVFPPSSGGLPIGWTTEMLSAGVSVATTASADLIPPGLGIIFDGDSQFTIFMSRLTAAVTSIRNAMPPGTKVYVNLGGTSGRANHLSSVPSAAIVQHVSSWLVGRLAGVGDGAIPASIGQVIPGKLVFVWREPIRRARTFSRYIGTQGEVEISSVSSLEIVTEVHALNSAVWSIMPTTNVGFMPYSDLPFTPSVVVYNVQRLPTGIALPFSIPGTTPVITSHDGTPLGAFIQRGILFGSPDPCLFVSLRNVSPSPTGYTCHDDVIRFTVDGDAVAQIAGLSSTQRAAVSGLTFGTVVTPREWTIPANVLGLLPRWSEAPQEDRDNVSNTILATHEGETLTVGRVAGAIGGTKFKSWACVLASSGVTVTDTLTITSTGPVFNTNEDEWLASYIAGAAGFSNVVQPSMTAEQYVATAYPGLTRDTSFSTQSVNETLFFDAGSFDHSIFDATSYVPAIISAFSPGRGDLTQSLLGIASNGQLTVDRYKA